MHNKTKVRLPDHIFDRAQGDKELLKQLVLDYMQRYPDYTVLKVKGKFAVCEIDR